MNFLEEYLPMTKAEESGLRPCVLLREREIFLIECWCVYWRVCPNRPSTMFPAGPAPAPWQWQYVDNTPANRSSVLRSRDQRWPITGQNYDNMLTTTRGCSGGGSCLWPGNPLSSYWEIHPGLETFLMCNDQIICIPPHSSTKVSHKTRHKQGTHVQKSTTNNRKL